MKKVSAIAVDAEGCIMQLERDANLPSNADLAVRHHAWVPHRV
jgi:hypothetical protein